MSHLSLRSLTLIAAVSLGVLPGTASADIVIGPGTAGTSSNLDGGGTRLNIALLPTLFTPGTYQPVAFNYDTGNYQVGASGQVIPFLATYNVSTSTYTLIAVGGVVNTLQNQNDASASFGGTSDFTISGNTLVYAGFQSLGTQNPISFTNPTTFTDHDNPGYAPAQLLVGFSFLNTTAGGFTNPGLNNRTYLFSISAVPEPGTMLLTLVGMGAGVLALRRRNRAAAAPVSAS